MSKRRLQKVDSLELNFKACANTKLGCPYRGTKEE